MNSSLDEEQRPPFSLLFSLALLSTIAPMAIDMYLPAFVAISQDLGVPPPSVQLTLTTFMIGLALGQVVMGSISDRFGRRRPMLIGTAVCTASSALCALAPNVGLLIVLRFFQGFSGAAGQVIGRAVVSDRARGVGVARVFSMMAFLTGFAPIVAPLLGSGLLGTVGWRGLFWVITGLNLLMFLSVVVAVPESLPPEQRHAGGLVSALRAMGGVVVHRRFMGYALNFCFGFGVMFAYIAASPFVYQRVLGLSNGWYSVAFAGNALGMMLFNAINARLVGRLGPRRLLSGGVLAQVACTGVLFAAVLTGHGSAAIVIPMVFLAVSLLGFILGNSAALAISLVPQSAGTGSAVLGALQYILAGLVSPLVGIGGEDTALPMAVIMAGFAILTGIFLLTANRATASAA